MKKFKVMSCLTTEDAEVIFGGNSMTNEIWKLENGEKYDCIAR
ncbi:hypothetical protein M2137_001870 [Parabacteroides sp. PFB2-10]|nr:hypothetical protein [Parabacteroides sp. PFB2-10]